MVRHRVLRLLFLISSIGSQVTGMMPEKGIAQMVQELPKELRYRIISFALELRENPKYELCKKIRVLSKVTAIALNEDNTRVITGSNDGIARLCDVKKGKVLKRFKGHKGRIKSVALSADGSIALTGSIDGTVRVWNILNRELIAMLKITPSVNSVALSADGSIALAGGLGSIARFYNMNTRELKELKVHASIITSVVLSADDSNAFIGLDDGTVQVWDTLTGGTIIIFQADSSINSVALSADDSSVLIGLDNGSAQVWNVETGTLLNTLLTDGYYTYAVALSKDGKRVFTGTNNTTIQVWNTKPLPGKDQTSTPLTVLKGHIKAVNALAFGGDDLIASGSDDGTVIIWKPFTLKHHYWPLKEGRVNWGAFTDQEKAAWEAYKETFSKPRFLFPDAK